MPNQQVQAWIMSASQNPFSALPSAFFACPMHVGYSLSAPFPPVVQVSYSPRPTILLSFFCRHPPIILSSFLLSCSRRQRNGTIQIETSVHNTNIQYPISNTQYPNYP